MANATNCGTASAREGWQRSGAASIHTSAERVAIKVLSRTLATQERFRHRFEREGRHIAALKHPNIVIAYDFNLDGDDLFIVMELVKGTSVRQLLDQTRQLPSASVTDLAIDVLAGLGHAHEAGVLHDDIKPSNILVAESGTAKLGDFGIIEPDEEIFDHADRWTILGSPSYSSPELLRRQTVAASIGFVLARLCAL